MSPRRENVYDMAFLARSLEDARRGNRFDAFEYHEVEAVLHSALTTGAQIPPSARNRVIAQAIAHAASSGVITASGLEAGLRRAERDFLKANPFKAVLAVPVSVSMPAGTSRKSAFRGGVTLARYIPKAFRDARASRDVRIPEEHRQHSGYAWFLARYRGRSHQEAYEVTLHSIDLVRAYWNYQLNRRTIARFSIGSPEPVNRIRLGRAHSLHAPGGRSLIRGYWDEPAFVEQRHLVLSPQDWSALNVAQRRIQKLLNRHPYRTALERAFVRYVRALDLSDFGLAFIKLWALLENLTATQRAQYDTTIKRTTFLFSDREITRHVLEHLRDQRNIGVHDDVSSDNATTYVYQLKRHVETLLAFHLNTGRRFPSLEDACTLLDQPTTRAALDQRIDLARCAIRFLKV